MTIKPNAKRPGSTPMPASISSQHAPDLDLPARFMLLGIAGFGVLALTAPVAVALLLGSFYDPRLISFVHLSTVGIAGSIIVGASYQLAPVVLQTPLASARLGRLSFWLYLAGLLTFLPAFWLGMSTLIALGGVLLTAALSLYVGVIARTLLSSPERGVVAWHLAFALLNLSLAVSLALVMALNKGLGFLGPLTLRFLAAHAILMFGGWIAVTFAGVAYKLVGMFTLAEDRIWLPGAWLELGLVSGGTWLIALSLILDWDRSAKIVGGLCLLVGLALFLAQLLRLYRGRRRRVLDVHAPFALGAACGGLAAAGLLALGFVQGRGPGDSLWVAAGWLAIAGLAETAIQGFFYKIATFLVWLHRYAPLAGRRPVPKLEELYSPRVALAGFGFWFSGVILSTTAIPLSSALVSQAGGVCMSVGLLCFLWNVGRLAGHWRRRVDPLEPQRRRSDVSGSAAIRVAEGVRG